MLEQRTVPMTEDEIDDYYRRRQEEALERYYAIRAGREIRESRGRLVRLAIVTVTTCVVCTVFLKLNFQVQQQTLRVAALHKEIAELRLSNEDMQKRMKDNHNLHTVCEKAESLGMGYPEEENVVYYSVDDSDYMIQTEDIR